MINQRRLRAFYFLLLPGLVWLASAFSQGAELPPELEKLRLEFAIELEQLEKPFVGLKQKYRESLVTQKSVYQKAGDLKGMLAVEEELKVVEKSPAQELSSFQELKRLQEIYRTQRSALAEKREELKLRLVRSYSLKTDKLASEWTREAKIAEAKLALGESERFAQMAKNPSLGAFKNSLGMRFVPVPINGKSSDKTKVLFSVWETRCSDYNAFVDETKRKWSKPDWKMTGWAETDEHPAVMVSWTDAGAFCAWLTKKEREMKKIGPDDTYRLPSDYEWSCAIGIGAKEDPKGSPKSNNDSVKSYPWGKQWPPPKGAGNFSGEEMKEFPWGGSKIIRGFRDDFPRTAPAGSFGSNQFGIFDLSGNVGEWCEDIYDKSVSHRRSVRGGTWYRKVDERTALYSSSRAAHPPASNGVLWGFRVVLEISQ